MKYNKTIEEHDLRFNSISIATTNTDTSEYRAYLAPHYFKFTGILKYATFYLFGVAKLKLFPAL
jgi:hypothetical protein